MPPLLTRKTVFLPEEHDMNHLVNVAKYGANRDQVTVVIERRVGARRTPLLVVTPDGKVRKAPASELRVTIKDRLRATANTPRNAGAMRGLARLSILVMEAERALLADARPARTQPSNDVASAA